LQGRMAPRKAERGANGRSEAGGGGFHPERAGRASKAEGESPRPGGARGVHRRNVPGTDAGPLPANRGNDGGAEPRDRGSGEGEGPKQGHGGRDSERGACPEGLPEVEGPGREKRAAPVRPGEGGIREDTGRKMVRR